MTEVKPSRQKGVSYPVARGNQLDTIHNLYIFEGKLSFYVAILAAGVTFLLFAAGLVAWLAGIAAQGWIASLASVGPGFISALFFNRDQVAYERMETVRTNLEKQRGEERQKREQALEDKREKRDRELAEDRERRERVLAEERKKQDREEYEAYVMLKLKAYYKLASKTDDEDQRKAYYHELFGPAEYSRQRIETYFNTESQIEDENGKRTFFREMFSSLFEAHEAA